MRTAFGANVQVTYSMREALEGADVAYVRWLRIERQQEHLFPSLREYHEFTGSMRRSWPGPKKHCT